MKRLIILMLIFCPLANAEEIYAVKKPNGSVSIIHYQEGSKDTLDDVIKDLGYDRSGYSVVQISEKDIPSDRSERDFWTLRGKKIVVDNDKKQSEADAKNAKEAQRDAVLAKLKISRTELRDLLR